MKSHGSNMSQVERFYLFGYLVRCSNKSKFCSQFFSTTEIHFFTYWLIKAIIIFDYLELSNIFRKFYVQKKSVKHIVLIRC